MGQKQLEAARALGFEIRNPQRFAHNMARLAEETGKAATVFMQPRATNPTQFTLHNDLAPALRTLAQLQRAWLRQPYKGLEAQTALWNSWFDLWHSSVCRFMGLKNGGTRHAATLAPQDPRFQHPAWSEDLDPHTRNKARFYLTQIVNAIAPTNWVFTNPELLHETFASDGENLVRGMQLLAEDIER